MSHRLLTVLASALAVTCCMNDAAWAQRGGMPNPEDSFRMFDRDRSGTLEATELEAFPSSVREGLVAKGIDLSQPLTREKFIEVAPSVMQGLGDRSGRRGGGRRFGSGQGSDGERRTPFDMLRRGRGNSADDGASGSVSTPAAAVSSTGPSAQPQQASAARTRSPSAGSTAKKDPKSAAKGEPARLTFDLPQKYAAQDNDGDGQIGMYEWDRSQFAAFMRLDRNQDGFLTPYELMLADGTVGGEPKPATPVAAEPPRFTVQIRGAGPNSAPVDVPAGAAVSSTGAVVLSAPPETAAAPQQPDSPEVRRARTTFRLLDRDKNGELSAEEWNRSRTVRQMFERAKIEVPLPVSDDKFIELYPQAQ